MGVLAPISLDFRAYMYRPLCCNCLTEPGSASVSLHCSKHTPYFLVELFFLVFLSVFSLSLFFFIGAGFRTLGFTRGDLRLIYILARVILMVWGIFSNQKAKENKFRKIRPRMRSYTRPGVLGYQQNNDFCS